MSAKLYYFDGRGMAELVRLTLATAGIPFTDELLKEKDQLTKWRKDGLLLYDQVPMLEIDGEKLVQSGAIVRHIARKAGMYGTDNKQAAQIDMLFEGTRDFYRFFVRIGFVEEGEVLKDVKAKALPRYLPVFDKTLKDNGSGYLVGDGLTLADIGLLEPLLVMVEYLGDDVMKDYPSLQAFYKKMTSLENISRFLKGPQRKGKNDDAYIKTVKAILY